MYQDLRQACRFFRRRSTAALLCTIALAIGIAAFTAIISIADAVLWHPLPYRQSGDLVRIRECFPKQHFATIPVPLDMLQHWDASHSLFADVVPFYMQSAWLPGEPEADAVTGVVASPALFQTLGVTPELGRLPASDDFGSVLLSHALWQSRFNGDRGAIGKPLRVGDRVFTIAGVMPPDFSFPVRNVRLWMPLAPDDPVVQATSKVQVIARLKTGVPLAEAQAAAAATIHGDHPGLEVTPFVIVNPGVRREFLVFFAAVLLVLVIAIGNAGNILLGEAIRRDTEIATRRSLGASTWRIARQLLAESLLISTIAAAAGILGAAWLVSRLASGLPRMAVLLSLSPIALDWRAAGLAAVASAASGTFAGLAPLWRARSLELQDPLRHAAQTMTSRSRLRSLLLATQLALSVVVLVSAGLLLSTFVRLTQENVPYDAAHLMTFRMYLPPAHFSSEAASSEFVARVRAAAASLPSVRATSIALGTPASNSFGSGRIETAERGVISGDIIISVADADEHYLASLGMPLLHGNGPAAEQGSEASSKVVVSRSLADRIAPRGKALGVQFRWDPTDPWLTVAGVVPDVRNGAFNSGLGTLAVYEPRSADFARYTQPLLIVRTYGPPDVIAPAIVRLIHTIDPEVPVVDVESGNEIAAEQRIAPRFAALFMLAVAVLALVIALGGVYGVFSCAALSRVREVGIRLALGATSGGIVRMMVGDAGRLVLIAVLIGAAAAAGVTQMLHGMLYEVSPLDPWTFGAAVLFLAVAALAATALAVRGPSRTPPMEALRME